MHIILEDKRIVWLEKKESGCEARLTCVVAVVQIICGCH